jgi:hypothetical protein
MLHSSRMSNLMRSNLCGLSLMSLFAVSFSVVASAQNPVNLPDQVGPTLTADPFTEGEKFDYRIIQSFGLRGFGGATVGAAIAQGRDVPKEWGEGWGAYATRYASGFGTNLARQSVAFGLESALHEDPRYFPSEEKGFRARMKNVLLQTVVARTDSGRETFAWARMGSAFAAGEIANLWEPKSTGTPADGLTRGCVILGGDLAYNFLQEFVPFVRPRSLRHQH